MPSGRKKNKRLTIGIFLNTLYENYDLELWKSVRAACEKHDINVITISGGALNSPYYYHTYRTQIYNLVNTTNVDGIISVSASIGNYTTPEKLGDFFSKFDDIPLVSIGIKTGSYATILVDNRSGMFDLVEHFVNVHKYSKIAFIKGPDSNAEARIRTQAYKDVLEKYHIPIDESLIYQGDFDRFSGIEAVKTLLDDRKADFEALIAANDLMAIYAMKELQNRGIKVPDQVAIGGFDNIKDNQYITPSLTTVTQPFDQIGEVAVQKIIKYYSGQRTNEEIIIPAAIIIGESCGCSQLVTSSPGKGSKNNLVPHYAKHGITQKNIDELLQSLHTNYQDSKINSVISGWEKELVQSLLLDLEGNEEKRFLNKFSEIFLKANLTEIEGLIWYNILDFIFSYFKKRVKNENGLQLLNAVWKDAFKIIGVLNIKKKVKNNMENEDFYGILFRIYKELIGTFNLKELKKIIREEFPKLDIEGCFLALFEDNADKSKKPAKLFAYFTQVPEYKILTETTFDAYELIPGGIKNQVSRFDDILLPVIFKKEYFGFALFEVSNIDTKSYEIITNQLGGLIKGALLLEKLKKYSRDLEKKVKHRTKKLEEAYEKIEVAHEKLKQLDTLKNDFIANITHDFRSPLTVILNVADLALKVGNLDDKSTNNYNIIYNASVRLKYSIDKLLDLARMDAEGVKIEVTEVPINQVLLNITDFYHSAIVGTDIRLEKAIPDYNITNFYTDVEKLEEVLHNIISNAIKFVDPKNGVISLQLQDCGDSVIISIIDNGIGIPGDKLTAIFNRFEQVTYNQNPRYKGTGIGLAFSKQLIDYLKGEIWAESEGLGKGSRFCIKLRKGKNHFDERDFTDKKLKHRTTDDIRVLIESEIKRKIDTKKLTTYFTDLNSEGEYDFHKGKILIVDDNESIREIIMKYLMRHDYRNFIIASDGKLALNAVFDYNPNLIICDYHMPEMNGNVFHDSLIANPRFREIPFIFLSAVADLNIIYERRKKGALAYLKKPIEENELILTVDTQLKKYFEYLKTYDLAAIDELTGLVNRREILNRLIDELAKQEYRHLSIIFFDIDLFKSYNDTYGHQLGDEVLKSIGKLLKKNLRVHDISGRYGGDEFILILPDTNSEQAYIVAQNIRTKIERLRINHNGQKLSVTSSFGVSSLIDNEIHICKQLSLKSLKPVFAIHQPDEVDWHQNNLIKEEISKILIHLADEALYQAKKNVCKQCGYISEKYYLFKNDRCPFCNSNEIRFGRNQVVVYQ